MIEIKSSASLQEALLFTCLEGREGSEGGVQPRSGGDRDRDRDAPGGAVAGSWWAGRYSRRGLPLRGRGAYGPVLTHGPRVVAAEAAGAEALVGVLKIIKNASYNKTRESPWWAMEKRPPLWWLCHHLSPCSGGTMGAVHLCYLTLRGNIEGLYSPPE